MMMDNNGAAISKERRIDVKLLKYELHNALQRKGRGNWKQYWLSLQQYLIADLSLEELNNTIESVLAAEDLSLHNAFITALLHNANTKRLPVDYTQAGTSPPKRIKKETPPPQQPIKAKSTPCEDKTDIINVPGTPPAATVRRKIDLITVDDNHQAIRRLLEITRSKGIRARCKVAETQTAALTTLLSKYVTKRVQANRIQMKTKYSIHSDAKLVTEAEALRSTAIRPHLGRLPMTHRVDIETGAYEIVFPDEKVEYMKDEAPRDTLPNHVMAMNALEDAAHKVSVRNVSPAAAKLLVQVVREHIRDLLAASAEAACQDDMMTPITYSSSIRPAAITPSDVCRMGIRSLNSAAQATLAPKLIFNEGEAGRPFTWSIVSRKKSTKGKVSKSVASGLKQTSSKGTKVRKSDKRAADGATTIRLPHLLQGITNYPSLSGGDSAAIQEKILSNVFNNY